MSDIPTPFPATTTPTFDEFFESGMEDSISPFLTKESRKWGKNVTLKSSILAAFFLILSYYFSFKLETPFFSNFFLLLTFFFAGIPALISSIEDLLSLEINIDVLMTLAAFLSILIGSGKEGALLLVLFSFSGALENMVRGKAKSAISSLKKIAPSKAFVIDERGNLIERSVKDIRPGTLILVKAGEIIPLDGKVVHGSSFVNLVHLTGENLPVTKTVGDECQAGSTNMEGALTLSVTHHSSDSTLARIIQLVTVAESAKPKWQRSIDRLSHGYAMTIIGLSIVFAVSFPYLFKIPFLGTEGSFYRALTFLIAASPCALVIALPIAYLSAISVCAKKGILLKGGAVLDALVDCRILAMDKTGTITKGELKGTEIDCFGSESQDRALQMALTLERNAVHPLAQAILKMAEKKSISPLPLTDFQSHPGYGLEGKIEGKTVFIGNKEFILPKVESKEVKESIEKQAALILSSGEVFTILLSNSREFYFFRFKDTLRPGILETISSLKKKYGLKVLMLTGDHYPAAQSIALDAGIETFFADLRPDDKLFHISSLAKKEKLVMVGDGVNDAPALSRAHVGISMGKVGSRAAVDASDIVLLQDNIELLEWLWNKATLTKKIVRQNLVFAFIAIGVATLPALLGWIPLWLAVILHEGGTVLVGFNALRLLRR